MRWLLLILAIPFLVGCSAEWHMKKAIMKNPALLLEPTVVTKWDTITMPPITILDTVEIPALGDSAVIYNDSVIVTVKSVAGPDGKKKLSVSSKTKPIKVPYYIRVECPPQVKLMPIPWYYKVYKVSFFILVVLLLLAALQKLRSSIL